MKSLHEYEVQNAELVARRVAQKNKQLRALQARAKKVAKKLVVDYLEAMGGENNGHEITKYEKRLIQNIYDQLVGIADVARSS